MLKKLLYLLIIMLISTSTSASAAAPGALLGLEGSFNTRDLGGYPAAGGKEIRSGLIFRSDDLARLTEADLLALERLGLKTVIDFRSVRERRRALNRLPGGLRRQFRLVIDAGNMVDMAKFAPENGAEVMREINRKLVHQAQRQYRGFFKIISKPENLPALFHCSAGKDRTGLAAALFLSALGTPREVIYSDYLLSAPYLRAKYAAIVDADPGREALYTVRREYLEAAFEEIERHYGGVENYLTRQLQVDIEKLRAIYLE